MPSVPLVNRHGAIIFARPHHTGIIKAVPGLAAAQELPSYFGSFNEGLYEGKVIEKLYNSHPAIFVILADADKAVIEKDYNYLIDLQLAQDNFFAISQSPSY